MLKPMPEPEKFLHMLEANQDLAYDVETNGLKWQTCYICGYSLSDGEYAYYVPVRHGGGVNIGNVEAFEKEVAVRIKKRTKKLIGHNIKFDKHFSQNHGIDLGTNITDTMILEALLDENKFSYSLENVCKGYDITQKKSSEIKEYISEKFNVPKKEAMGHYHRLAGDDKMACEYARTDTLATYQLFKKQERELYAQELDVIVGVENRLISVLQKMERRGIMIDLQDVKLLKDEVEELQLEAYRNLPMTEDLQIINVQSNKDLKAYFEYLNIQDWPITDKGNPSFNKAYLKTLDEGEVILNARKLDTFMNMFLEPLNSYVYDSILHTNFNQTAGEFGGTKSGRLSSYAPNMQQIPKRDEFIGYKFRKIFKPRPGFVMVEFDYSQAEPRLFSHYSKEPILIEGYNKTPFIDMHAIASQYMGIDRNEAKSLNLGMMYVMGSTKLAIQLGITTDEAKQIVKKWYKTFVRVGGFTKAAQKRAEERGYVKTILGRRARFKDIRFTYRAANRIIQGGCADILKWKLVELDRVITQTGNEENIHMVLNIHDSVVLEIREDKLELIGEVKEVLERVKCEPFNLSVPFVAEYKAIGKNWAEATYGHKLSL